VSVGGEADAEHPESGLENLPELHIARLTARHPLTAQVTELLCPRPATHSCGEAFGRTVAFGTFCRLHLGLWLCHHARNLSRTQLRRLLRLQRLRHEKTYP
jgi:hypothetical protein